jgi:hypothetical protein
MREQATFAEEKLIRLQADAPLAAVTWGQATFRSEFEASVLVDMTARYAGAELSAAVFAFSVLSEDRDQISDRSQQEWLDQFVREDPSGLIASAGHHLGIASEEISRRWSEGGEGLESIARDREVPTERVKIGSILNNGLSIDPTNFTVEQAADALYRLLRPRYVASNPIPNDGMFFYVCGISSHEEEGEVRRVAIHQPEALSMRVELGIGRFGLLWSPVRDEIDHEFESFDDADMAGGIDKVAPALEALFVTAAELTARDENSARSTRSFTMGHRRRTSSPAKRKSRSRSR